MQANAISVIITHVQLALVLLLLRIESFILNISCGAKKEKLLVFHCVIIHYTKLKPFLVKDNDNDGKAYILWILRFTQHSSEKEE